MFNIYAPIIVTVFYFLFCNKTEKSETEQNRKDQAVYFVMAMAFWFLIGILPVAFPSLDNHRSSVYASDQPEPCRIGFMQPEDCP